MKIAFDVDVLAKQMSINDMVHKVADWGYKYIDQSPHPASTRSTSTRSSPRRWMYRRPRHLSASSANCSARNRENTHRI